MKGYTWTENALVSRKCFLLRVLAFASGHVGLKQLWVAHLSCVDRDSSRLRLPDVLLKDGELNGAKAIELGSRKRADEVARAQARPQEAGLVPAVDGHAHDPVLPCQAADPRRRHYRSFLDARVEPTSIPSSS